jgi:hypothetical protein
MIGDGAAIASKKDRENEVFGGTYGYNGIFWLQIRAFIGHIQSLIFLSYSCFLPFLATIG